MFAHIRQVSLIQVVFQVFVESGVVIRGDLAKVKIGKNSLILENTVIRPAFKILTGGLNFFPAQIGSYTQIGKNCVVEALKIGSYVHIGDNCIIVIQRTAFFLWLQLTPRFVLFRANDALSAIAV